MPSMILTGASGAPFPLVSGNFWSGQGPFHPSTGGIQLKAGPANSGNIYVGLSGGMTVNSGGFSLSGNSTVNTTDGMLLGPGDSYFVPKMALNTISGGLNIFVACEAVGSGRDRIYYELY